MKIRVVASSSKKNMDMSINFRRKVSSSTSFHGMFSFLLIDIYSTNQLCSVHREFGTFNERNFANNRATIPQIQSQSPSVAFNRRNLEEQQAALNLAYLATTNTNPDGTQQLIDALIVRLPIVITLRLCLETT